MFIFCAFINIQAPAIVVVNRQLSGDVQTTINRGLKWLLGNQDKDGSFGGHAGITALAAMAFMRSPQHYTESNNPFVKNATKYIVSTTQPDGSIYDMGPASYTTAVAIMALVETKNPNYEGIIEKAQKYIMDIQLDENEGITSNDKMYGGIGYGKNSTRGDMSNLHLSLEALKESGVSKDADVWEKAIKFIERCQNRSESNDQTWVGNDGGFIYSPEPRSESDRKSYGSMTYAGVESFIYANVDKNDPRVQDAVKWIKANYTLDENPPIGSKGLYYYYCIMAKAFAVYGEAAIVDSNGVQHNWYEELARKLIKLQKPDGSWVNQDNMWMESIPILTTAYAILALSVAYSE